ncbi:MAG TPA: putative Ig domain-containing protein [Candidatus Krumholzibacterium sp.]|nr:putative Ig domain-containing protein [Candidatus Krumholzibacterium sp.]
MRKVFVVLLALSLGAIVFGCSDDETTITPVPDFSVSTAALDPGYTCTPYNFTLEAEGGTAPYTWSLAVGSTLPDGISMSTDGQILGMLEVAGEHSFSVVCTDAASTPHTQTVDYTLSVDVPANPSLAIFFDEEATLCGGETQAFSALDCHVFIMLEDAQVDCATATEFMIVMNDQDGNPLGLGSQYTHSYVSFPSTVSVTMGDPFNGLSVAFTNMQYEAFSGPIHVASFGLLLLENLDNIAFEILANPDTQRERPIITSCDAGYPIVEVDGRSAAVNYPSVN